MDEEQRLELPGVSADDWRQTPESVRNLVVELVLKVERLEKKQQELEIENERIREKSERTSENSHSPPSSDPASHQKREKKKPSGKKRGGQPGHSGHSRPLYPVSECQSVTDHYPETCQSCGERLVGVDPNPYRHQVVEIPPIRPRVEEHRLHRLTCPCCGRKTRAVLPEEVEVSGYGPRVVAIVAVLSGMYRHSHRMVVSTLSDLFGLKIALGTVNRLRQEASESLEVPVDEAASYLRSAPIVGADETGFEQGNTDGKNPQNKKAPVMGARHSIGQLLSGSVVSLDRGRPLFIGRELRRDSDQ